MAGQSSVTPLVATTVAWSHFLEAAKALTGHSLTSKIDSYTYKLSDFQKWLMALEEFTGYHDSLLDQLFFGFLITGKKVIKNIILRTSLSVIPSKNGEVAIVTGKLSEWQNAIISILQHARNQELIYVFDEIYLYFDKFGLISIFSNYQRKEIGDHYFLLEYHGK